jgi:dipeptidyl aminopeptidase/acylaminoacyl peptidase
MARRSFSRRTREARSDFGELELLPLRYRDHQPRREPTLFPTVGTQGRVAYAQLEDDTNIWRQELPSHSDAVAPPINLIYSTVLDRAAQFSPDGSRIVFQSARSGNSEIWACASDGTHCGHLTAFNGPPAGSPSWSPDGRRIAFDSAAAGNLDIYLVTANGGRPQRLTFDPAVEAIPRWSRDGRWIYLTSNKTGRPEIWKIPGEGGTAIQVTHNGGSTVIESHDAKTLYYTKQDGVAVTLWRSNPDGSGEREVIKGVFGRCFDVTADRIYFIRREASGVANIRSLMIATEKEQQIAPLLRFPGGLGLSLSPGGKYLIYSQIDRRGGDLMLVENFR